MHRHAQNAATATPHGAGCIPGDQTPGRVMQLGSAVKQSLWSSAERPPENNPENPYRLRSICLPDIPTAAWLCVIDRASPNALLLHGRSVLVRSDGFVEGGWAGRFDDGDFMSSGFL